MIFLPHAQGSSNTSLDADRGHSLPPTWEEGRYMVPDCTHSSKGDKVVFREIF